MASTVLIETSVPSAYVSNRQDAGSIHRREATREWWRDQLHQYDAWTSDGVILELSAGEWPGKTDALKLLDGLPRVAIDDETIGVARRYIEELLVPDDVYG